MENRNRTTNTYTRNNRSVSSAGNRRQPVRPAARRRRRRKKRFGRLSRYARFIILYSAVFILLAVVVAIILTAYLSRYEAGQPTHVVEAVVEKFQSADRMEAFLKDNAEIISPDLDGMEDSCYPFISGKELSFISDSEHSSLNRYSYYIMADQSKAAAVTLDKTGSDSWTLSGVDLSFVYPEVKEYTILVPEGSEVYVNGKVLDVGRITGNGIPEVLQYSAQFLESSPELITYTFKTVSGQTPLVSGTDPSGQPLVFQTSDSMFVAECSKSSLIDNQVKARVEEGVEEYALYFEYLAFNLRDFILEDCERYEFIFGSDQYDPINPELYMFEYIGSYEFRKFTVSDYIVYSEDCFTVDVIYNLLITFVHDGPYGYRDLPDDNPTMDATWVWVKDGDTWKVADIQDHFD